jgi:poly(hydroxyalkanoate) granule-associated protein
MLGAVSQPVSTKEPAMARTSRNMKITLRKLAGKAREAAITRTEEARAKTMDAVSQLEKLFEHRVSRAMARLGVPTQRDVRALSRKVAELQASVASLKRSRARA